MGNQHFYTKKKRGDGNSDVSKFKGNFNKKSSSATSWKILCSCKYWVSNKHLLEHSFFFGSKKQQPPAVFWCFTFWKIFASFSLEATLLQKEYPGSNAVFWWHMVFFLRRSVAESGEFLLAFPFRSAFNNGLMGKLFVKDTNLKCSKNSGKNGCYGPNWVKLTFLQTSKLLDSNLCNLCKNPNFSVIRPPGST